jgi:hypothetical protein
MIVLLVPCVLFSSAAARSLRSRRHPGLRGAGVCSKRKAFTHTIEQKSKRFLSTHTHTLSSSWLNPGKVEKARMFGRDARAATTKLRALAHDKWSSTRQSECDDKKMANEIGLPS